MVTLGLKDAGYEYVIIDDGWQSTTRGDDSRQRANTTKFPNGIVGVADYVHSKNLSLGIYSSAGIMTCGFLPGSWGYEELDAQTYAGWGVDYLKVSRITLPHDLGDPFQNEGDCRVALFRLGLTKCQYDNCGSFEASTYSPFERFSLMRDALRGSGRNILYSLCQWGSQFPWFWADQISHSYRMSGDIHNSFSTDGKGVCTTAYCLNTGYAGCSVLTIMRKMREISSFQGPGSWADMDMMYVGTGSMTTVEEQTHFSFWAALKSPLIIGADLGNISSTSVDILLNKEIIAINQDGLGKAVNYVPSLSVEGSVQTWVGPLSGHRLVALVFNEGSSPINFTLPLGNLSTYALGEQVGMTGQNFSAIRDVWKAQNLISIGPSIPLNNITSHETRVIVFG